MEKKVDALQDLCERKIPLLLSGFPPEQVFNDSQRLPKCMEESKNYGTNSSRIRQGMDKIKLGEVYVHKGKLKPYNALVITKVEGELVSFFDTSCMNTLNQLRPCREKIGHRVLENFFEKFELANSQQLEFLLSKLREGQKVMGIKVDAVEKYALVQSLPKCTEMYPEQFEYGGEHPFKKDGDGPHPFKKY